MANVFSTDPNCLALWSLENGALTTDSIGTNTLTNSNVTANVADYQEGSACGDFESDSAAYLYCAEADLESAVPGVIAGAPQTFLSISCWFKPETVASRDLAGIWHDLSYHFRSWRLTVASTGVSLRWHRGGAAYGVVTATRTISTGTWYHVGATLNCVNQIATVRLYDAGTGLTYSGQTTGATIPAAIYTESGRAQTFRIGGRPDAGPGEWFDGLIDEVVLFKDILTNDEIDAIRQGNYGDWIFLSGRANALATLTGDIAGPVNMCVDLARFHPETRYREQLVWRTDIIKGANGSEQRLATRRPPRQRITLSYVLESSQDSARGAAMLHTWAKRQWGLPIWHERVITHATLSAGATTISIDTTAGDFRDDSFALLWQAGQYEVIDIETKTDSQLNLSAPLVNTYTGKTFVMPYRRARLIRPAQRRRYRGGGSVLEMPFEVIDNAEIEGHSEASSYDSMEILTTPAYLPNGVYDERHDPDLIILDGLTGAVEVADVSDFAVVNQPHIFVGETQAEAWSYRRWLCAIYGRQKKFLVPTFHEDFDLTRQLGAADTTVYVANIGLAANVGANDLREYIGFRDGGRGASITIRRITAISQVDSSEESLTIDAAVGSIIPMGSLVCWVDQCRLASDTVDIDWYLPGKCVSQTRLVRGI